MNIILTSGNCIEPIDSVRSIVNSSSGKLGALICETLVEKHLKSSNDFISIYYICSRKSALPGFGYKDNGLYWDQDNNIIKIGKIRIGRNDMGDYFDDEPERAFVHIIYADSASEIYDVMKELLTNESKNITHVIHARAISDYSIDWVSSSQKIESIFELCDEYSLIKNAFQNKTEPNMFIDNSNKISSNEEDLIIRLVKTKKIVDYIKKWNPNTTLISFKLLDNVSKGHLIDVAKSQMLRTQSDYVVANDISQINDSQHIAHILNIKGEITTCNTKQEIAETITRIVINNE